MSTEFDRLVLAEKKLKVQVLRNKMLKESFKRVTFSILLIPAMNLISGFGVMLALGAAHDQWPVIPALGYWTTVVLCWGIGAMSGILGRGHKTKIEAESIKEK